MFTIFTVPKAFIDTTQVIQENAISSWKALHPDIEIVLFGDEKVLQRQPKNTVAFITMT